MATLKVMIEFHFIYFGHNCAEINFNLYDENSNCFQKLFFYEILFATRIPIKIKYVLHVNKE